MTLKKFTLTIAAITFTFFASTRYDFANAQSVSAGNVDGCPISGQFSIGAITSPIDNMGPQYEGRAWRTRDIHTDGFSRIDCYLIPPNDALAGLSHIDILLAWAEQEGLEQDGIWAVDTPYPHSRMRSRKVVGGREIMFEHRLFLFPNSFVLAVAAADFSGFPSAQNIAFLTGLRLTGKAN